MLGAWRDAIAPLAAGAALALAATFKPALLGLLPVMVALGRWRWAAATVAARRRGRRRASRSPGPALAREYATVVLPRAALYGEGGTEDMLLHEQRAADHGRGRRDAPSSKAISYRIALPPFDGPASASLPRLFAPHRRPTGRPAYCPTCS